MEIYIKKKSRSDEKIENQGSKRKRWKKENGDKRRIVEVEGRPQTECGWRGKNGKKKKGE